MTTPLQSAATRWQANKYPPHADTSLILHPQAMEDAITLANAAAGLFAHDDDEPLTEKWLLANGWARRVVAGFSKMLPLVEGCETPVEVIVGPVSKEHDEWAVSLSQGAIEPVRSKGTYPPDEHIVLTSMPDKLTRGDLRKLLAGLKGGAL
jgi:hypothetical protein